MTSTARSRPGARCWHTPAQHILHADEVLDDLRQTLRHAGRFYEAITAKRQAIAAGYDSGPDPEADIAEMLVEAGRLDQAAALFATLRDREPDDLWLYNSAAWAYGGVDPPVSLRWALDGIDVALATGDPDRWCRSWSSSPMPHGPHSARRRMPRCWARVQAFVASWTSTPSWDPFTAEPPLDELDDEQTCDHCGYAPTALMPARPDAASSPMLRPGWVDLAFAWFPAGEWAVAIKRWPDLTEERPADHTEYSHQTEADQDVRRADAGPTGARGTVDRSPAG